MTFTQDDADKLRGLHEQAVATRLMEDELRFFEECLDMLPRALTALEEAWEELQLWYRLILHGAKWSDSEFDEKYEALLGKAIVHAIEEICD